jgi:EspA/EspE family
LKGNTEVSWLNGASDLMTCVKSAYSGGSAIQNQDWATLGASAATIVGKGLIYAAKRGALQKTLGTDAVKKALPTPTAIVDFAALALLLVDFLNGFGTPNSGSAVSTAADKLDLFMKDLDPGCVPDARDWSGTAATAYIAQNALLKGYASDMKTLDKELKGYLASQAAKVKEAHMCITVNVAVLTAAAGIALALYMIPVVGVAVSQAWQIVAAFACCMAVFVVEMLTLSNSMSLSHDIAALGQKYVKLGKDVETKLAGSYGQIRGKVATETASQLSNFRGISDGLTSFSFAPSISDLADKAGSKVSAEQRELLDVASEKGQPAAKTSAGAKAETPAPAAVTPAPAAATPVAPAAGVAFTPPSLAQMTQMANVASQMSQPVSSLGQSVNQGVSQVQQMAQSGKGPGDPAPPADEAADGKDKDAEAGAAAGSGGAERAPIDAVTSGAEQAGPGRERVL